MAKDKKQDPDVEAAIEKLTEHVAEMDRRNAALIERVTAAAEQQLTPRERRAAAQRKLQTYHDDVRAGKRQRIRTPARGETVEEDGGENDGS